MEQTSMKSDITWHIEKRKISDLKEFKSNPRQLKKEQFAKLVRSLKEDGYHMRMLVNLDNTIIGGHQRKKALLQAGYGKNDEIEVLIPSKHLEEEDFKRILIRDNLHYADWDFDALANEWDADKLVDWGMPEEWLHFEKEEIEVTDEDNEAPGIKEDSITKLGDIWQLGEHRLMCGDSTDINNVELLIEHAPIDLLFTDPPYNVSFNGRSGKFEVINNDDLEDADFESFIKEFASIVSIIKPANYYIWCNWKFYGLLQSLFTFKACIVWAKNVFGMGVGYRHQHEFCLFNGAIDENIKDESDLWEVTKDSKYQHPTQKPIELAIKALKNHRAAKNVLDLFGGSGSTLIACEKSKRKCFMMELSPNYCDVIIARWEKLTGQKAVLCPT